MHDAQTFLTLGGLLLLVIGFTCARKNLAEIRHAFAASKWPSVEGEVESAGISEGYDYAAANGSKRLTFSVVVRYNYRLGGRIYTSDKSGSDGQVFSSYRSAQRAANKFGAHKPIKVHVSPEDPKRSMIAVGMKWQWRHWVGLIVGIALFGLGVAMILARFGVR